MLVVVVFIIAMIALSNCGNTTKKSNPDNDQLSMADSLTTDTSLNKSEITCPKCGFKSLETMPTDVCLIKYDCKKCSFEMRPENGDCCVFCSYGNHKCPSMQ